MNHRTQIIASIKSVNRLDVCKCMFNHFCLFRVILNVKICAIVTLVRHNMYCLKQECNVNACRGEVNSLLQTVYYEQIILCKNVSIFTYHFSETCSKRCVVAMFDHLVLLPQ